MRDAAKIWVALVAIALLGAGCEWSHVRGDAALTGRASTVTAVGAANLDTLLPEWQSAEAVLSSGESVTLGGPFLQTQQGAYLLAPLSCAGSPVMCPPAWTRSGWAGPGTGEAPPTQAGTRSFVLPTSTDVPGAPTLAAYSVDGTAGCAGSPVVCSPLWSAAATGLVPGGANVGGVAAPTVSGSALYVTTGTGQVLAYATDGGADCTGDPVVCEPLWGADGVQSSAPVAVVDGTAFATGASDPGNGVVGGLFAFAADGASDRCGGVPVACSPLWRGQFGSGTEVLTADQVSPAAVVGDTAYVVAGSALHAFATDDLATCTGDPVVCAPVWTVDVGPTEGTTRSAPAVVGDRVYVPRDGGITVVPTGGGAPIATFETGAGVGSHASGVVEAAGLVWFGTTDGLLAFDASCTGTCAPLLRQFAGQTVTTPAVNGDRIHVVVAGTLRTLVLAPPLKLGNPRNFLGTGDLLNGSADSVAAREGRWLAVSGYCTRKAQGDRIAAKNTGSTGNDCAATGLNSEYDDTNYSFAIDLPPARTEPVDVVVFDGNFLSDAQGQAVSSSRTREFTPGGLGTGNVLMPTTFTLHQADATPHDDTDNPTMDAAAGCAGALGAGTSGSRTFPARTTNSPDDNYNVVIPGVANAAGYWLLCRIPVTAPAGRYPLHVRNQASATGTPARTSGSNSFGLLALPTSGGTLLEPVGQRLCDTSSDATCPEVVADRYLGINSVTSTVADPFLARVPAWAAGKVLEIQLWDPAEGAVSVGVRRPSGPGTWAPVTFSWSSTLEGGAAASGTDVDTIDVTSHTFNNALVTIRVPIPADAAPGGNDAWRIRIAYGASATDRTTWSARIIDAP